MTTSDDLTFVGVGRPARRRRRAALGLAATLALVLGLAACGGDDDDDGGGSDTTAADGDAANADATLTVTETAYTDVSAPAGGTLAIVNETGSQHTFTADNGEFDESYGPDETITVDVPEEPGDYPFHCEIHPSMTATLTAE